ncbi:MAG: DUF1579 domain-containing protein [Candidatus Eremiobacteraeota bacterium]|nr:DUF1579 domain-containing protein [Candidatus Eremiobacteraeota bacterium]
MLGSVRTLVVLAVLGAVALSPTAASAQAQPDSAALIVAQREAMTRLANMDGVWRGPASTILPSGVRHDVTQTERIGPFLDGTVKVIEGRGYNADGTIGFNAFGVISYQPNQQTYTLRSYALGYAGDFPLTATPDGYVWQIPTGPTTIRYTVTIRNGTWREVGDRVAPGKDPVRFFEMNLKRVGDTKWPGDGAISPQ